MLRVLHLAPRLRAGGGIQEMLATALGIRPPGVAWRVASIRARGKAEPAYLARLTHLGIPVDFVGRRLAGRLRTARALRPVLREWTPDVVHAHGVPALFAALDARGREGRPAVVLHLHGRWAVAGDSRREARYRTRARALAARFEAVDAVLCVSRAVLEDFVGAIGRGRERCRVVYPGRDLGRYRPARDDAERARLREGIGLPPGAPLLVAVGRLSPEKDYPTLLEALARLPARVRLAIVGEGSERAALRATAARLGVEGRTHFLGYRADVAEILGAADVYVLASRREAFGMAAVEAQATGLPAVVTDCGGPVEIVEPGETGFVVPVGDPAALAGRIEALVASPDLRARMGAAARSRAARFDVDTMVAGWLEAYAAALARRS